MLTCTFHDIIYQSCTNHKLNTLFPMLLTYLSIRFSWSVSFSPYAFDIIGFFLGVLCVEYVHNEGDVDSVGDRCFFHVCMSAVSRSSRMDSWQAILGKKSVSSWLAHACKFSSQRFHWIYLLSLHLCLFWMPISLCAKLDLTDVLGSREAPFPC